MEKQDKKQAIANRLKEARTLSGLSQGQAALKMQMHRPTISEIEAGRRRVSAEELSQFAALYDVGIAYLAGDGPDTLALEDPRLRLAARELQNLPPESLDKLLQALAAFRTGN
jgi:transcriptional regulator with XRE-family HTH domain